MPSPHTVPARLIGLTGLTNLAFWLLWPAGIVRVAGLDWGPVAAGLFGSAAWLAMMLAMPIASRLVLWIGHRSVAALATGLIVAAALGIAIAPGGPLEWVWTAFLGFGTGLRWIACDSWIADVTPPDRVGRMLSLGEMVVGLGFGLGPAMAAAFANMGPPATIGLSAALIAGSGGTLIIGVRGPVTAITPLVDAVTKPHWLAGIPTGAALLLLASALLGGLNESGFAGIATLIAVAGGGDASASLAAAAAVGFGSFVAQYALGAAADRWGGCKVLMACAAMLTVALTCLAIVPAALPYASFVIGGVGGGLYTVAVIFGLQAQRGTGGSASMIGAAAICYTIGTLAAPTLAGVSLATIGPAPTLLAMAALVAALLAAIIALQAWRWVDRTRNLGPACAFRVSPTAFGGSD